MNSIAKKVQSFYEQNPFPGFDDNDTPSTLIARAHQGYFAQMLDTQIPFGARILDVGCGTGQLSHFLALKGKRVVGLDFSHQSLLRAEEFKKRFGISGVTFIEGNLFTTEFTPASFDYILCSGVLHHTANPDIGFSKLCWCLKPGGYFLVGLYNTFSRMGFKIRRVFGKTIQSKVTMFDHTLQRNDLGEHRKAMWFTDQYKHPYESSHSVDEVLKWFYNNDIAFINAIPKITLMENVNPGERLFSACPVGSRLEHILRQLLWCVKESREGGYFIMVGRKQKR